MNCFCGCGVRAVQKHHAFYVQHLPSRDLKTDERNLVPAAHHCHMNHHGAGKRYRITALPDSVFEFGGEVFGARAAPYLKRRYSGEDPRLEALLDD